MYLTQAIHRMVQRAPDGIAVIDGDLQRSWSELAASVARFAGALQALGLEAGDRVAMLARNGDAFVDYFYGTLWAGGVVNPVNLRWRPDEIGYSLEDCGTRILFIGPEFEPMADAIRAHSPGLQHLFVIGSPDYEAWLTSAPQAEDAVRRGDDLAAIMYTGGTTGHPKGVMLSHRNFMASALGGVVATGGGARGERYLHTAPLFHIGALSGLVMSMIWGNTSVLVPAFEPVAVLDTLERHQVRELFLVPTMMRMLIDHPRFSSFDPTTIQTIRYGASPIDAALMDRLLAIFPHARFEQAYGMTEIGPVATVLPSEDHRGDALVNGRVRSAGRATGTTEVRIVDSGDFEVPRGEVGEIVVRGEGVMLGYWGQPELTAETLRGGWMHTGDLGRMDDEGYVTVVDRLKDMIITGGENVYSSEVENALSDHPAIAAAAVIALPDAQWGERVHAVIVCRPGADPDRDSIDAHARARLAGFKVPRSYAFVDALPLSAAGKVLKHMLRDQHAGTAG